MNPRHLRVEYVARALKLSEESLWNFARTMGEHFKPPRLQRVGSKVRTINAPRKPAKRLLRRLHRYLARCRFAHSRAHGGVTSRSCFTSAREHLGQKFIWTRDARDCFPSVTSDKFFVEMKELGFQEDVARLLTLLCTLRGSIPQGSPVSNDALNLFFWRIDQNLASSCGARRLEYSRVTDDFVISGSCKESGEKIANKIVDLLNEKGICVNERKMAQAGLQTPSRIKKVHNIDVTRKCGTKIAKDHWTKAVDLAARYVETCRRLQADSICSAAHMRSRLCGWMHYARQAQFGPAKKLRQQLELGDRLANQKLKQSGLQAHRNRWWLVAGGRNEPNRIKKAWVATRVK